MVKRKNETIRMLMVRAQKLLETKARKSDAGLTLVFEVKHHGQKQDALKPAEPINHTSVEVEKSR